MRLQDGVLRPETDNDVDLGATGAEFKDLYIDGVAYIDSLQADQLGAALDANNQAITNVDINSGAIDGTVIGAASAAAGSFTTVAASSTVTSTGRMICDDTTDATSKTDGSLQTDGGLSVAKKIYSGTDVVLAADSGTVTMGAATALVVSAAGAVAVNNATDSTAATNGSLQTDGGLGVVKDAVFGNDVKLLNDSAVLSFGADSDTTLTHTDGTGLTMNSANKLCFRAASQYIYSSNANMLSLGAASMISLNAGSHNFMGANGTDVDTIVRINGATTSYGLNLPNTSTTGDAIANSWSTYSDATLKKDITPIENALEKVMSMKGVSYEYKSGGGRKVGFLAQDMQSVVPEVVKSMQQEDDKDLLCISYDQLTSVLVEAVKAQQAQIEDLKSVVVKLSDNS
jgi:hypothetical protein